MESDNISVLVTLPKDVSTIIIATCEKKNILRQTCTRFCEFASRRKNETILIQPQLYLTQEALDRYLLYYGVLGNTEIVRNLLARGANPNAREDNNITLMYYATRFGYDDIVKMLLEQTDLSDNNKFLCECKKQPICTFSTLTQMRRFNLMKFLLLSFGPIINEDILCVAVRKGYTSAVQLLVDHDADVDTLDKNNERLLYSAWKKKNIQILKILLENGAEVNTTIGYSHTGKVDQDGIAEKEPNTLLDIVGNKEVRNLLIEYGGKKYNDNKGCVIQ